MPSSPDNGGGYDRGPDERAIGELILDFIASLDEYAAAED